PVITLYDLARAGATPLPVPARLPALGMRFRPPFTVIGPRLYFVAEEDGTMTGPNYGTVFVRHLVALDWTTGHVSWMHPLTPRARRRWAARRGPAPRRAPPPRRPGAPPALGGRFRAAGRSPAACSRRRTGWDRRRRRPSRVDIRRRRERPAPPESRRARADSRS